MSEDGAQQLEQLLESTRRILGHDDVTPESSLEAIGIDSLNIVELMIAYDLIYPGITNPDEVRFSGLTTMLEMHTQLYGLSKKANFA
jgi:hypothetical protein